MTQYHAYLFEIRSIQGFLFATGKLRDMVAGSELIDYLCREPLDDALRALGLDPSDSAHVQRPRCAGGAAYLVLPDANYCERLRCIWGVLIRQLLPGLELVDTCVSSDTVHGTVELGLARLRTQRNQLQPLLPAPTPLTALSPRTGQAAYSLERGSKTQHLDQATSILRKAQRLHGALTERFATTAALWPNNFEQDAHEDLQFPLNDNRMIGLIHIDGNGLGELLRQLNATARKLNDDAYVELYSTFSNGLEQTTCRAAQRATEKVLRPAVSGRGVMPARPLVLGGDDLSVIVRADLALPFARAFIEAFEQESKTFLQNLHRLNEALQLPEYLTACGGVVFMKASHPFGQGYHLAEGLCSRAKQQARKAQQNDHPIPSTLSFHRIQNASGDSAEQLFKREMRTREYGWELGLRAYHLGESPAPTLPKLADLESLSALARPEETADSKKGSQPSDPLNLGRLRSLATLLHQNPQLAKTDYERWRILIAKTDTGHNDLQRFDAQLYAMVGELDRQLPFSTSEPRRSPLSDLLTLRAISAPNKELRHDA